MEARRRWLEGTAGDTGIPALDKLGKELGVKIYPSGVEGLWSAGFAEDYDVLAVCRRYEALAEVKHAWNDVFVSCYAMDDNIYLKQRGAKLLFVFQSSRSGIDHFYYFEVDPTASTIEKRAELNTDMARDGRIHLWGVPARFPTTPFADFGAVLKAAGHKDWWVALHALEVTGRMLSGVVEPQFGEEGGVNLERFYQVRDGLPKNEKAAYEVLLRGLEHKDPDLRLRALWHLRNISKLKHTGDADGIRAWKAWAAD